MKNEFLIHRREFVRRVRVSLAAKGEGDIMLRPSWFVPGEGARMFVLNAPIGSDLVVHILPHPNLRNDSSPEDWDYEAGIFANALINLWKGEKTLNRRAKRVVAAARREVCKAREQGLDIRLLGASFKDVESSHVGGENWREAIDYILPAARCEVTDNSLARCEWLIIIDNDNNLNEDMAKEVSDLIAKQKEYQEIENRLEKAGVDLEISDIGLEILRHAGLDPSQVLRNLLENGSHEIILSDDAVIFISRAAGSAAISLRTAKAFWNGALLNTRNEDGLKPLPNADGFGCSVMDKIFGNKTVSMTADLAPVIRVFGFEESRLFFDAKSGNIWAADQRAAA